MKVTWGTHPNHIGHMSYPAASAATMATTLQRTANDHAGLRSLPQPAGRTRRNPRCSPISASSRRLYRKDLDQDRLGPIGSLRTKSFLAQRLCGTVRSCQVSPAGCRVRLRMIHAQDRHGAASGAADRTGRMRVPLAGRRHTSAPRCAHALVPMFATRTEGYHTEVVMTNAVIREFAARTRMRMTPDRAAIRTRSCTVRSSPRPSAADLQHLDRSSRPATLSHLWSRSRFRTATARFSTRTRTTPSASNTNPLPICPRSSTRAPRPKNGCRAILPGRWSPTCSKDCRQGSEVDSIRDTERDEARTKAILKSQDESRG